MDPTLLSSIQDNDDTLKELTVSCNLGKNLDALEKLSNALSLNTNIVQLNLSRNKLSESAVKHINHMIENNNTLTILDLSSNNLQGCVNKVISSVRENFSLLELHIDTGSKVELFNHLNLQSTSSRKYLLDLLQQNKTLANCRGEETAGTVSFTKRKLKIFPRVLYSCQSLRHLDMSYNALTKIPSEFYQLSTLQELVLSNNNIVSIDPYGIASLSNLTYLNLENNLLHEIPFSMSQLPLKELNIAQNLILSPHTFPQKSIREKGATMIESDKYSKCSPIDSIPYSRLYVVSQEKEISKHLLELLQEFHYVQSEFSFLSSADKEILSNIVRERIHECKKQISITNWTPTLANKKSSAANLQIPISRKDSVNSILPSSFSPRNKANSFIQFAREFSPLSSPRGDSPTVSPNPMRKRAQTKKESSAVSTLSSFLETSHKQTETKKLSEPVDLKSALQIHIPTSPTIGPRLKENRLRRSISPRAGSVLSFAKDFIPGNVSNVESPRRRKGNPFAPSLNPLHISCCLLDSSCIHSSLILLGGASNHFSLLIVFRLYPEFREVIEKLTHLISSSIAGTKKNNPVFIAGVYEKTFRKRKKLEDKIQHRISQVFPHLVFDFVSVCSSSGHKVKKLNRVILRKLQSAHMEDFQFLFQDSEIPPKWYQENNHNIIRIYEHFQRKKEEIQFLVDTEKTKKSILSWEEFVGICLRFGFPKDDFLKISIFLRNMNVLHHFQDFKFANAEVRNKAKDFLFLDPEILFKFYGTLLKSFSALHVTISENSALTGITKFHLSSLWSSYPKDLRDVMIALLKETGQIWEIGESIIVPQTFPSLPPSVSLDIPPLWHPHEDNQTIEELPYMCRCFSFYNMNDVAFCKLISFAHNLVVSGLCPLGNLSLSKVYRNSLDLKLYSSTTSPLRAHHEEIHFEVGYCRISFDYGNNCISLFVNELKNTRTFFCWINEEIGRFFPTLLPPGEGFTAYSICVCNECGSVNNLAQSAWIRKNKVESAAADGNAFVYCPRSNLAVRIDLLAPDISLSNLQHMIVDYSQLEIINKVGEGGFASVYYGTYNSNPIAIKKLHQKSQQEKLTKGKEPGMPTQTFPEFRNEVSLMAGLQHPNIVKLIGICKQPLCVITGFCAYGDLFSYIKSRRLRNAPFPLEFVLRVLRDIANGMNFLHTATPPILHRDLKSPNVLLCQVSPDERFLGEQFEQPNFVKFLPASDVVAKVADFGLSLRTHGPVMKRVVDNPLWLAPELLSRQPYSSASDVYSFAIVAWEMVSLQTPYEEHRSKFIWKLEDKIMEGLRPTIPDYVPQILANLIWACWDNNAKFRPKFSSILSQLDSMIAGEDGIDERPKTRQTKKKRRKSRKERFTKDLMDDEEFKLLVLNKRFSKDSPRNT